MSSGGRKHVFVFSVQHTGTWFLIRLLRSVYPKNKSQQCGDGWFKRRTDREINTDDIYIADAPIRNDFLIKYAERYVDQEILKNIDLFIAHGHHHRPGGNVIESLKKYKPGIPIVIPMRDPLMSINSKIWREYGDWKEIKKWETKEDRIARAKQLADNILEILEIPKGHIFLFPIDIEYSTTEKLVKGEELCKFCNLTFNEGIKQYLTSWQPQNETQSRPNMSKEFLKTKKAYEEKDLGVLSRYLDVEINYLQTRTDLKEKLIAIGYKDLLWFGGE